MNVIIDTTFVVNRIAGISTSLLVTLKAHEVTLETVDGKIVSDYDTATAVSTRSFLYTIPPDQQTDKVDGDSGYMEKVRAWIDTYTAGHPYMYALSDIQSEVL